MRRPSITPVAQMLEATACGGGAMVMLSIESNGEELQFSIRRADFTSFMFKAIRAVGALPSANVIAFTPRGSKVVRHA